ncbi:hypothetical protein BDV3_003242 [Batrachochytrium dendrobatidis]|nr:hypothetical protein O5D80_002636 [Batrachochytrium dendrobatidis]
MSSHTTTINSAASQELENYQFQLDQVNEALKRDPTNEELLKLSHDLAEVVSLFQLQTSAALLPSPATSTNPASSAPVKRHVPSWAQHRNPSKSNSSGVDGSQTWQAGQIVLARWTDDQFYEARVVGLNTVATSDNVIYDIVFTGFETVEQVSVDSIKQPLGTVEGQIKTSVSAKSTSVNALTSAIGDGNKQFKKKKAKRDGPGKVESEQLERQNAWLKFAGKSDGGTVAKKKAPLNGSGGDKSSWQSIGLKRKSMFSTPDDPNARVGVIGSGKPMTQFQTRGRHVFSKDD